MLVGCGLVEQDLPVDSSVDTGEIQWVDTGDGMDTSDTALWEDTAVMDDPIWRGFLKEREAFLVELSVPISSCALEQDTSHAVFAGCIDWHSAVHATYALHAIARVTGDAEYMDVVSQYMTEEGIQDVLIELQAGGPSPNEIPYGFSWFLKLAKERELAGFTDLAAHADLIAEELRVHIMSLGSNGIEDQLLNGEYSNLSWEVYNLWEWAVFRENAAYLSAIETYVLNQLLPRQSLCPLEEANDHQTTFFPACLHLARVLVNILPEPERTNWINDAVPETILLDPITAPQNAHAAGQNFSRTYGLYDLWQATGYESYRDAYIAHIETHMGMPAYWLDSYTYSHWVAQFGVYGIMLSYDGSPGD